MTPATMFAEAIAARLRGNIGVTITVTAAPLTNFAAVIREHLKRRGDEPPGALIRLR